MGRANAQGFTQDAYHGTPNAFSGPVQPGSGSNTGQHAAGAIYASDNPAVANSYARGANPAVYPLRINPNRYSVMSADEFSGLSGPPPAQGQGAPGVQVSGVRDYSPLPIEGPTPPATTYGAFDPSTARPRFDPFTPEGYRAPPSTVSAATLDRARIAMAGRGRNLMTGSSARPDVAGGLFSRADDIDAALAGVTDIQPARETYRRFSDGIEGVEIGQGIRSADPDQLAARLNGREGARFTAPVGAARSLETAIGTPTEGATGLLNRIATSTNMKRNLGTIFGQAEGARYQEGVGNLTSQLNNARFMASSTGSQSIGRAADMVDPIQIPQGPIAALMMAIDKIRRGVQLTEAESEVLVRLGQQPATRGLFGGSRNRSVSGYAVPTTAALLGTLPAR